MYGRLKANLVVTKPRIKYHLPLLSSPDVGLFRAPGPGLGNLLFPIARAVVGRETLGGRVVIPTMRQISSYETNMIDTMNDAVVHMRQPARRARHERASQEVPRRASFAAKRGQASM